MNDVYQNIDQQIGSGSLLVERVWEQVIGEPIISRPQEGTLELLGAVVGDLWCATGDRCGAKDMCNAKAWQASGAAEKATVYQCEVCGEWFHLRCINDRRPAPTEEEKYICNRHGM